MAASITLFLICFGYAAPLPLLLCFIWALAFVDSKGSQCFVISTSRSHLVKLTMVVKHYVLPAQAMTQLVIIVIVRFQVNSPVPLLPHNVLVVFVRQCTLFRSFLMFLIRTLNFVANLMNLNLDSYICSWFVLSLDPCLSILVFRFWGHVLHCCRLLVFVSGHVDWSSLECLVLDEQVQYTNPRWIDMW